MDSLKRLPRWLVLGLAFPLIVLNGWLLFFVFHRFQTLITIFIIANLLAFLLDYPVQFLQKWGLKRTYLVPIVVILVFILLSVLGITVLPVLITQLDDLARRLPGWITSSKQQLQALEDWGIAQGLPLDLQGIEAQFTTLIPEELRLLPNQALDFLIDLADRLIELLLTIVFTLYLLLHGREFWDGILRWLPLQFAGQLRLNLKQQFRNYFLGQAILATMMGISITTAFWLLKIPFWLVFGMGIGLTVLVPFGDFVGIAVVSVLVALQNVYLGGEVLMVAIVIDQVVDSLIAPRILGHLFGLNPVWVLLSLLMGAQIGNLLGLLIAVPSAGCIKALLVASFPPSSPDASALPERSSEIYLV